MNTAEAPLGTVVAADWAVQATIVMLTMIVDAAILKAVPFMTVSPSIPLGAARAGSGFFCRGRPVRMTTIATRRRFSPR